LLTRLKKLLPGSVSGLDALVDPTSGTVHANPKDMARLLSEHWGKVLTGTPIDEHKLATWLRDVSKLSHTTGTQ